MERLPANDFQRMAAPLSLDLLAAFSLMEEDTYRLLDRAVKEKWDTETLLKELAALL